MERKKTAAPQKEAFAMALKKEYPASVSPNSVGSSLTYEEPIPSDDKRLRVTCRNLDQQLLVRMVLDVRKNKPAKVAEET